MELDVKVVSFPGAAAKPASQPVVTPAMPSGAPAQVEKREARPVPAAHASEELRQAIDALASRLKPNNTSLSFRVDVASSRVIVTIFDAETGAVLRQIPAEELMRVAQNLQETSREHRGALLNERA